MRAGRGFKTALAIISVAGVLLVLVITSPFGAGTTPDSAVYSSAAENLLSGRGYTAFDGSVFVHWPPFFPTLIAALTLSGMSPLNSARLINALLYGLMIFVSGIWLTRKLESKGLALLGTLAIALSPTVLKTVCYVWSEPLLMLFALLFLVAIDKFSEEPTVSLLFLSILFAGLASLSRYAGITVIISGFLILITQKGKRASKRFTNAALFGMVSAAPLLGWLLRNLLISSSLAGQRPIPQASFSHNFYLGLLTIKEWFLPLDLPGSAGLGAILLVFLLFLGGVAISITGTGSMILGISKKLYHKSAPAIIFVLVYFILLLIAASLSGIDQLGDRMLVPAFIPLLLIFLLGLEGGMFYPQAERLRKRLYWVITLGFVLWLFYPFQGAVYFIQNSLSHGPGGYSSVMWHDSEIIEYLRQNRLAGTFYSNDPYALYLLAGIHSQLSPVKRPNLTQAVEVNLSEFKEILKTDKEIYLIWFEKVERAYLCTLEELSKVSRLEKLFSFSDGDLYLVKTI